MTLRTRKLIGVFGLLGSLAVYAAVAVTVHQLAVSGLAMWLQLIYFAVAGIGWTLPAMAIITWMTTPD